MSLTLPIGVALFVLCAALVMLLRRAELLRMGTEVRTRRKIAGSGAADAQLQYPVVDLSRCMGCATCVASCPEENVLGMVHGQAAVINATGCVGVAACARECPVGAINVTLADLSSRRDVPVLEDNLEARGVPGLFVGGELTAYALVKTAIEHGARVARAVHGRRDINSKVLDLCIVGAGPAGLACALEAKRLGLDFVVLEREAGPGGTVAKYPRKKLVMTQAVHLPLHGQLKAGTYTKEDLVEIWGRLIERHKLPIRAKQELKSLQRDAQGGFCLTTNEQGLRAQNVCLALGRRGTPVRLGVPGEQLTKVSYGLMDARAYSGQELLVVGGGNSAVEAALALSEGADNRVTLSYRKAHFFRLRGQNEERLQAALAAGKLRVVYSSQVRSIDPTSVELALVDGGQQRLPNDHVFILAGGQAPFGLLESAGVSFDPSLHPVPKSPVLPARKGFAPAAWVALGCVLLSVLWVVWNADYYFQDSGARAMHPKHEFLGPSHGLGQAMGYFAAALIGVNLLYLLRRAPGVQFQWGSLQAWMKSHVVTGLAAFLCATLHCALGPRDSAGGHAFWALGLLLFTGAVGRYFYALVPRAANGQELELEAAKQRLRALPESLDVANQRFFREARERALALVERCQWSSHFFGRLAGLLGMRLALSRLVSELSGRGVELRIPARELSEVMQAVRETYRRALMAAHFEDLRALLSVWRYVHRWATALMLLLLVGHVFYSLIYATHGYGGGPG